MDTDFKMVIIYIDEKNNILIIPTSNSEKYGGFLKEIDIVYSINNPYTYEELGKVISDAIEKCYSMKPDDFSKLTPIEKYLNIKGYAKAVKSRKLVLCNWNVNSGYSFIPTHKIPREGYSHLNDKAIKLNLNSSLEEIGIAAIEAIKLSIIQYLKLWMPHISLEFYLYEPDHEIPSYIYQVEYNFLDEFLDEYFLDY